MEQPRETTSTKGIVRPREVASAIDLRRYPVAPGLAPFVERYWAVHWDRRGLEPYLVRLISQPCVNITLTQAGGAMLHGVGTGTSTHPLLDTGRVFGVKFRPGGYAAYTGRPAVDLTDRSVPLASALRSHDADEVRRLSERVLAADDARAVELLDEFLAAAVPSGPDDTYQLLLRMIEVMLHDRGITQVGQVADRFDTSVRTLQRLFRHYLGVGPKWLIRRYRLHDGAERLASDPDVDPAALAVELGWFDQAHFTRDFSTLIGTSPMAYAAACQAEAAAASSDLTSGPIAVPGQGFRAFTGTAPSRGNTPA